jgi:hypothetical protein
MKSIGIQQRANFSTTMITSAFPCFLWSAQKILARMAPEVTICPKTGLHAA